MTTSLRSEKQKSFADKQTKLVKEHMFTPQKICQKIHPDVYIRYNNCHARFQLDSTILTNFNLRSCSNIRLWSNGRVKQNIE